MKNISVIIPTLSNEKGLNKLLKDIFELDLTGIALQIILIDNSPSDYKSKLLQIYKKKEINIQMVYLPQKTNLGFAEAANLGAQNAKQECDWLWFLNDDIEIFDKNIILSLIKKADQHNWSAITPILQKVDGRIENIGYTILPEGKALLNFDKNVYQSSSSNIFSKNNLAGITAACLLIKKNVFEKIGGFDNSFFAYLEDVDLFLRMKRKGYNFGVAINSKVVHHHRSTSKKMGCFKQKQDFKNWWKLIWKNWTIKEKIVFLPRILIERGRNLWGIVKRGRWYN